MALGLAVIFGLMGVINMAHGEFMMLGAFTAYVVCEFFKRYLPPEAFNYYFVCAVPAAFMLTACAGWLCEWALIRHLYRSPSGDIVGNMGIESRADTVGAGILRGYALIGASGMVEG